MSKRSLPGMPKKKILLALCVILIAAAVGISQPLSWPGGWGIGKEKSVTTTTIEKDGKGNIVKSVETTKIDDGKTLWDWLSLLGVPVSLAVLGYVLQQLQQKRADELAKEEVLQVYFDRLSVLLVDKNLLAIAAKGDQATGEEQQLLDSSKNVIRARTLSILRRFENDPQRKGSVIRFLTEADIDNKLRLNLSKANLSGANLSDLDLSNAFLSDADLSSADLSYINFNEANLTNANLTNAYLRGAILSFAKLHGAKFNGADLRCAHLDHTNLDHSGFDGANLSNANLANAEALTVEQLDKAKLCCTRLPEGIPLDPNRDCKELEIPEN
jgi:uncharacterized protein YjbI with pentapeptide repeats